MISIFLALTFVSLSIQSYSENELLKHIDIVNSNPNSTWRAGQNFDERVTLDYIRHLCGALKDPNGHRLPVKAFASNLGDLPTSYDTREKWGNVCPSVKEVRDQGSCGSCWAFGAAEAMTDRICIQSEGQYQVHISAEDLLTCCVTCGFGCSGGMPEAAWQYYVNTGIVSGGPYNSLQGCQPYEVPSCDHHVPHSKNPCKGDLPTPACHRTCIPGYNISYSDDKVRGSNAYRVPSDSAAIMSEIMTHGPVEADFNVYSDFPNYKSGVYRHVSGMSLGGHAIKILGWGEEGGNPFWLVANSWNHHWGDNGYFKILRGSNECGIESGIVAGLPRP